MANPYQAQWDTPRGVPTFPVGGPTVFGAGGAAGSYGGLAPGQGGQARPNVLPTITENWVTGGPLFPNVSAGYADYLGRNIGQGASRFDLSTFMPSTGAVTQPGQLTADVNPALWDLSQYLQEQLRDPSKRQQPVGGATLQQMLETGMPIDQLPAWTAMTNAMDRQYQQGRGDIRSQMAGLGLIGGSPHETAQTDYSLQAARDKNALLASMQTNALEAAQGRKIAALELAKGFHQLEIGQQQFLANAVGQMGQLFQGMDQAAIDRTLAEFMRTRPEYGPLLNLIQGLSTTFPQFLAMHTGLGGVGAVVGNVGQVAQTGRDVLDLYNTIRGPSTAPSAPAPGGGGGGVSFFP